MPEPIVLLVWALLTGMITGAAWLGVVVIPRFRQKLADQAALVEEARRRLHEIEDTTQRLADMEERLDFAERLLETKREPEQLQPPNS
ncbi:MAG: hypothetical protein HOP28_11790 [Gemmatimonadales bacterium]|nr:hypothetical protein [Gemmatimonadales bacterium]